MNHRKLLIEINAPGLVYNNKAWNSQYHFQWILNAEESPKPMHIPVKRA